MARELSKHIKQLERGENNDFLQRIKVEDLLEHLNIANVRQLKPDTFQFSCPFSGHAHGDEHPSAVFNDGTHEFPTMWRCFGCHRHGDAITFVAEHQQIGRVKARRWLREHYAPGFNKPLEGIGKEFETKLKRSHGSRANQSQQTLDWQLYERFLVDWEHYVEDYIEYEDVAYMVNRGFTAAQLTEFRLGYDIDSQRITIPIIDIAGNLVGVKGRSWRKGHQPRYLAIGDRPDQKTRYGFPTYEKSKVLFGLDRFGEQETYVLCEGELDVLSLHTLGIPTCCTGSSAMSKTQEKQLRAVCDKLVIYFDNDKSGNVGMWGREDSPGIIERLKDFCQISVITGQDGDANSYLKEGRLTDLTGLVESAEPWYIVESRRRQIAPKAPLKHQR